MRRRLSLPIVLCAVLLAGCAGSSDRFRSSYRSRPAKIDAVLAALRPQVEQSLAAGPNYSLTELEGLHAANQLGAEGRDASMLWEQEVADRYRDHRADILRSLRAEIAGFDDDGLDDVMAIVVPASRNARWRGQADTRLVSFEFAVTSTARDAHILAVCGSLESTPARWAIRYPGRAAFTFERFGIDRKLIDRWCEMPPRL